MNVTPPINSVPIGAVTINGKSFNVATHPEFVRFFDALTQRVGGPVGPSTPDLTVAQFEDAGIEETKAQLYGLSNDVQQDPQDLREQVEALSRRVASLEQGMSS